MSGIVVCPQPQATEVGVQILEAGGNAFDAALAVAFVQMIIDPFMCGVGGMASIQTWNSASRKLQIIDGGCKAGSRVSPEMWIQDCQGRAPFSGSSLFLDHRSEMGYSSICVPGTVAALGELHRQYCSCSWAELLQPAICLARQGFRVTPYMLDFFLRKPVAGLPDGLTRLRVSEACAALYLHQDGSLLSEGEVIYNHDYANTLELLALKGAECFYRGELAHIIGEDFERNSAWVTTRDLQQYYPRVQNPGATSYRAYQVYSNRSPAGGPLLLEALNLVEGFDLSNLEHNSPEHLAFLALTLCLVFEDRLHYLGDPETMEKEPEKILISKKHAQHLRKMAMQVRAKTATPRKDEHTTHLVVVDGQKNIANITHTLGWASGVITPGLGFIHNNGMNNFDPIPGNPNSLAPGKWRLSSLMPTMVFDDLEPRLALGALGGNAILSACLQAVSNVLDFGMTPIEAVSSPRLHAEGSTIWCEARFRSDSCKSLEREGYNVEHHVWGYAPWLGQVQLVHLFPDGSLQGGSDPRGGGGSVMHVSK